MEELFEEPCCHADMVKYRWLPGRLCLRFAQVQNSMKPVMVVLTLPSCYQEINYPTKKLTTSEMFRIRAQCNALYSRISYVLMIYSYCLKDYHKKALSWDFSGGPVVESMLPMQGMQVGILVRDLHALQHNQEIKNKKSFNKNCCQAVIIRIL